MKRSQKIDLSFEESPIVSGRAAVYTYKITHSQATGPIISVHIKETVSQKIGQR
jgi:hypothetical protein